MFDMDDKIEEIMKQLENDYMALYEILILHLNQPQTYQILASMYPYFSLFVVEGYNFLSKYQKIPSETITKKDYDFIVKCRAKGCKLYEKFSESTFESLNEFNRKEYIKFYRKKYKFRKIKLTPKVKNYFVSTIEGRVICNYHLYSKKYLNVEIGTYKKNVKGPIYDSSYFIASFVTEILISLNSDIDRSKYRVTTKFPIIDVDFNMAYDYNNFGIKGCPPINMAFLDILSAVDYYLVVFTQINRSKQFEFKIKYVLLSYTLISLCDLIYYCEKKNIKLPFINEEVEYFEVCKNKCIRNLIIKLCKHYDPTLYTCESTFESIIETQFNSDFESINKNIDDTISEISNILNSRIWLSP